MKRLVFIFLVVPVLLAGCSAEKHQDDRLRVIFQTDIDNDNESMLEQTQHHIPVAAIYDTLSIANGFPAFIEKIRSNRRTEQIIIIAMTSSLQVNKREECTKLGANLCISFPFNIDYLNSALEKLLLKRESIAEYYKSPMSTYVIDKGKFIHNNIADPALTAPSIAKHLGMSTRAMYRRLEGITDKKLHMVIKSLNS